jgi:membrane glycosyltransferase
MMTQSADVCRILLGRDSGWSTQQRADGSVPLREIVGRYWRHTALGLLLGASAWAVSPYLALWMLPVVLGAALAIPLAAVTGTRRAGQALRRIGLLRTPEEIFLPPVLARAAELAGAVGEARDAELVTRLLDDPTLLAAHRCMLPLPRRPGIDPLDVALLVGRAKLDEAVAVEAAWGGLTRAERAAVLADDGALTRLTELRARAGAR